MLFTLLTRIQGVASRLRDGTV